MRTLSISVWIPKLECFGSANEDIKKRKHSFKSKIKFWKIWIKIYESFSYLWHWGHPLIPSSCLRPAVYSLDVTLADWSGKEIPSSSKHVALFSTGRSTGGELAFSGRASATVLTETQYASGSSKAVTGNQGGRTIRKRVSITGSRPLTLDNSMLSSNETGLLPLTTHALTFPWRHGD